MRYSPAVILTLFALTLLIALAQSAARPTVSGTGADQSGAVAQRATGASKNTAINRYHENDSLNAKTRGRYRPARKPETIPVSTASQFTSALSNAQPGDTILLSGTIQGGRFTTTRSGVPGAPITIRGDGTARVSGSPYALEILHDYYRLENFILENSGKGLVIDNAEHGTVNHVHAMDIQQEAFKLRNQSRYWEFTFCSARRTGLSGDFGEGFYVGQASSNWINNTPDQCAFVTFFNCYTLDTVNDGWDIKEGSHDVKVVNCTADFSGGVEPAGNAAHGSAGYYCRADNVQFIKSSVVGLNNGDWGYRYSNTTVGGVDYGSAGNQIKQSAVFGGNVGFIFAEGGTNGVVFDDFTNTGSGGFYATGSATVTIPASSGFSERTWLGEGGGVWGDLDPTVGASGDPLGGSPPSQVAAPSFNPGGGVYSSARVVAITTSTIGASIRYTTDGGAPTSTSGAVYSGPVTISVTTTLKAIAYKSGMTDSSVTTATYTISGGDVFTQDISVASGNDDAKQRESGTVVTNSWRHPLGYDGVEQLEIGLRFTGLIIPRNATVTAAYIQFEADKSDSGSSSLTIKAELNANAAAFTTTANNITNRPLTGASVAWSPPAWTQSDRGAAQKTPDLKALVQAIVNQSTWNAGNAIVFVITGTGTRTAEAFESGAAKAPHLHVEWQ
jgi:Chitobiase/beta-hexosaminidase C-terminal domain